jgi:hypothetical protein
LYHIHSSHSMCPHSCRGERCFYITGSSSIRFFSVSEGVDPSTRSNPCLVVIRQKIRLFASRSSCRQSRRRSFSEFFFFLHGACVNFS